jgi:hypothetical protein
MGLGGLLEIGGGWQILDFRFWILDWGEAGRRVALRHAGAPSPRPEATDLQYTPTVDRRFREGAPPGDVRNRDAGGSIVDARGLPR